MDFVCQIQFQKKLMLKKKKEIDVMGRSVEQSPNPENITVACPAHLIHSEKCM